MQTTECLCGPRFLELAMKFPTLIKPGDFETKIDWVNFYIGCLWGIGFGTNFLVFGFFIARRLGV